MDIRAQYRPPFQKYLILHCYNFICVLIKGSIVMNISSTLNHMFKAELIHIKSWFFQIPKCKILPVQNFRFFFAKKDQKFKVKKKKKKKIRHSFNGKSMQISSLYIYQIKYFRAFSYFMSTWGTLGHLKKGHSAARFNTALIVKLSLKKLNIYNFFHLNLNLQLR